MRRPGLRPALSPAPLPQAGEGEKTAYVSQLERGATQARGPALALLNVIRRKGLEALS